MIRRLLIFSFILAFATAALVRALDAGATTDAAKKPDPASHWSFAKPVRPEIPRIKDASWCRNPVDYFVLNRLEKAGLHPSPEADRAELIRRVYLDLIGLLPTPAEVDAFIADQSPDAYEKVVDRLLANPHYGERWGRHWLDLARYADTNGYEKDRPRVIWPYRDWVIRALNRDEPFDQFAIDQLAGDMLPNPTPDQIIATGFHRNTMINEEGGIDVEEFRFKAMVDRVQTTAAAFLGLTLQCAQCHNHKYDPITQKEYYQFFALLNNADEPEYKIPDAKIAKEREKIEEKIARIESSYESAFPMGEQTIAWETLKPQSATSANGATLDTQADGSVLVSGTLPSTDSYTITLQTDRKDISAFRLEALTDPSLPNTGPGREGARGNGNFVLSRFRVLAAPISGDEAKPVEFKSAQADVSQSGFPATAAIDGKRSTGWAIDDGSGHLNQSRTATFETKEPVGFDGGTTLSIILDQHYPHHTLGKFRISAAYKASISDSDEPTDARRKKFLEAKQAEWEKELRSRSAHWHVLDPTQFSRNYGGTITKLDDHSLLFTGDNYYRDEYKIQYQPDLSRITAIRLEVLPHPMLENGGPGRNPTGGWLVSELSLSAASAEHPDALKSVALQNATADTGSHPEQAIDGKRDTHWAHPKGDLQPHELVAQLKEPLNIEQGGRLAVSLLENYHQQENVGRLRMSVTDDQGDIRASGVPADIEQIVLMPSNDRTPEQATRIRQYFLSVTPLLAEQHQEVATLRASMPKFQTTMVMRERPTRRVTQIHRRGEFLSPTDVVEPGLPAILHPGSQDMPRNRLELARWLVSENNPLIGRVVMNRVWARYFGKGIVKTVADFGTMGERPTDPELLDWLATEFVRRGWSLKQMHRLIVTSATYRQTSRVTPELLQRDPANALLSRGPRFRVDAEIVRDIALCAGGLLDPKIGGPSVYPPQPDGVSQESWAALPWVTSKGGDRYRRGMYTFLRRTSPYPGLTTFDAPTAEVTCPVRNRSDTPLQALTVLNDQVFVEAAQAMARRMMKEGPEDVTGRARLVFRWAECRDPQESELAKIITFYQKQLTGFREGQADPAPVALADPKHPPKGVDLPELAAWTLTCRAILNLDETVTK